MEWRYMCFAVCKALLLILLSKSTDAIQCKCSDLQCINIAIDVHNSSDCCLWDFPPNPAVSPAFTEFQEMGYAYGRTTADAPHFCITYPVDSANVDLNNYFLVKLDLEGPIVCISEPGKTEEKSCSETLSTKPVSKAVYCTGEAVSGVQSVNFSIDCINCSIYDASFQFQVYSAAFEREQDKWCDEVDTSVPSERIASTSENTPSTVDLDNNSNHEEEVDDHDDDDSDSDNDSHNSSVLHHGTTYCFISTFILLITAAASLVV